MGLNGSTNTRLSICADTALPVVVWAGVGAARPFPSTAGARTARPSSSTAGGRLTTLLSDAPSTPTPTRPSSRASPANFGTPHSTRTAVPHSTPTLNACELVILALCTFRINHNVMSTKLLATRKHRGIKTTLCLSGQVTRDLLEGEALPPESGNISLTNSPTLQFFYWIKRETWDRYVSKCCSSLNASNDTLHDLLRSPYDLELRSKF